MRWPRSAIVHGSAPSLLVRAGREGTNIGTLQQHVGIPAAASC
jgi:hypothetical protein